MSTVALIPKTNTKRRRFPITSIISIWAMITEDFSLLRDETVYFDYAFP